MNEHFTNSDKLASVVGVVGEVITTMAITVARECQTKNVVYIGSSFNNNPLLRKVIEDYTVLRGCHPFYIENGAFSCNRCPSFKLIQTKNINIKSQ